MKINSTKMIMSDDLFKILKLHMDLPPLSSEITITLKRNTPVVVQIVAIASKDTPYVSKG